MVDLFLNRVLVENNWDQDELNTEREILGILENRILLLFFASAQSEKCQEFLPVLNDFFKRLKDPAYIEYPKLMALIYVRSSSSLVYLCDARTRLRKPRIHAVVAPLRFLFPLCSLDQSEEQQERVLKELHKKVLFLAFEDPYRK